MNRKSWLCLPPVLFCLLDHSVTVWGQPSWYWDSAYQFAVEGSPYGRWLLEQHPLAFAGAGLVWAAVYAILILRLPLRAARAASLTITMGHGWGVSTWLLNVFPYGYWLSLANCLADSALFLFVWDRSSPTPAAPTVAILDPPEDCRP